MLDFHIKENQPKLYGVRLKEKKIDEREIERKMEEKWIYLWKCEKWTVIAIGRRANLFIDFVSSTNEMECENREKQLKQWGTQTQI